MKKSTSIFVDFSFYFLLFLDFVCLEKKYAKIVVTTKTIDTTKFTMEAQPTLERFEEISLSLTSDTILNIAINANTKVSNPNAILIKFASLVDFLINPKLHNIVYNEIRTNSDMKIKIKRFETAIITCVELPSK